MGPAAPAAAVAAPKRANGAKSACTAVIRRGTRATWMSFVNALAQSATDSLLCCPFCSTHFSQPLSFLPLTGLFPFALMSLSVAVGLAYRDAQLLNSFPMTDGCIVHTFVVETIPALTFFLQIF